MNFSEYKRHRCAVGKKEEVPSGVEVNNECQIVLLFTRLLFFPRLVSVNLSGALDLFLHTSFTLTALLSVGVSAFVFFSPSSRLRCSLAKEKRAKGRGIKRSTARRGPVKKEKKLNDKSVLK